MTHQMPVPQAAQSPYPLQPAPQGVQASRGDSEPAAAGREEGSRSWRSKLGIGAALGLASAIAATFYVRKRRSTAAKAV